MKFSVPSQNRQRATGVGICVPTRITSQVVGLLAGLFIRSGLIGGFAFPHDGFKDLAGCDRWIGATIPADLGTVPICRDLADRFTSLI